MSLFFLALCCISHFARSMDDVPSPECISIPWDETGEYDCMRDSCTMAHTCSFTEGPHKGKVFTNEEEYEEIIRSAIYDTEPPRKIPCNKPTEPNLDEPPIKPRLYYDIAEDEFYCIYSSSE